MYLFYKNDYGSNQNSILSRNHPKSEIIITRNVLVFLFLSFLMSGNILDQIVQPIEWVEDWILLSVRWSEDYVLLSVEMSNSNRCRKKLQTKAVLSRATIEISSISPMQYESCFLLTHKSLCLNLSTISPC